MRARASLGWPIPGKRQGIALVCPFFARYDLRAPHVFTVLALSFLFCTSVAPMTENGPQQGNWWIPWPVMGVVLRIAQGNPDSPIIPVRFGSSSRGRVFALDFRLSRFRE
jgi:hypothetical protein